MFFYCVTVPYNDSAGPFPAWESCEDIVSRKGWGDAYVDSARVRDEGEVKWLGMYGSVM